jgi:gliding motility-associated-like protein
MKKYLFSLLFVMIINTINASAQGGVWTWMNGSDTSGGPGNYGVLGIASDTSVPVARYQSAYWKDKQGNFWMFGGVTWQNAPYVEQNDLWKFNPTTNQWAWMNGPQFDGDVNGEFGTMGIPSVNNYPSVRGWGVNCWTDTAGMLWLYGGYGADSNGNRGDLNDLWKYNPYTNEWTWMKGKSTFFETSKFGTKDVFADSVTPGSIQEVKSSWVDKNNSVYLFGGKHLNAFAYGYETSNHMWQYNQSVNQWRWRKGNNAVSVTGAYGAKGIEDTANYPPGRASYTKWADAFGNFYIFGGGRFLNAALNANQPNMYNDTWKYNPITNAWTWVNGPNVSNTYIGYGPFCIQDSVIFPNPRIENQTAQNDVCVNAFWNFGGFNMLSAKSYNDLWLFNSLDNDWIRVHGKDTAGFAGNAGQKGIANVTNDIGGRCGVNIWVGNNNNDLWVFGGINYNTSDVNNDMWRFVPDSNCFKIKFELPLVPPNDTNLCAGENTFIYGIDTHWIVQILPNLGVNYNVDSTEITFAPSSTTTYTMIAVDERLANCVLPDTLFFTISVDSLLFPNITFPNFNVCANVPNTILLDSNYQYTWWQNNLIQPNLDTSQFTISVANTTTISIVASYKNKCSVLDTLQTVFTVLQPIYPVINTTNPTICAGDSTIITINNDYVITVLPNNNISTNTDTTLLICKPIVTTTYTIVADNINSLCTAKDTFTFTIFITTPQPIAIGPFAPQSICVGETATIQLPASNLFTIQPSFNTIISNNSLFVSPLATTIYTISVIPNNACELPNSATWQINVNANPNAAFVISPTILIKPANQIQLQNQSTNSTSYQWFVNPFLPISTLTNVSYTLFNTGQYCFTLIASNAQNCKDTTENCITFLDDTNSIIYLPNVFSPNGDTKNDYFGITSRNVTLDEFSVYNRWGNLVFSSKDLNTPWNGFYKGKKCDVSTYYYIVKYKTRLKESKILTGDVTLIE